jgi:hypothetical protein
MGQASHRAIPFSPRAAAAWASMRDAVKNMSQTGAISPLRSNSTPRERCSPPDTKPGGYLRMEAGIKRASVSPEMLGQQAADLCVRFGLRAGTALCVCHVTQERHDPERDAEPLREPSLAA